MAIQERDHSACGVGIIVNLPKIIDGKTSVVEKTHEMVSEGLKRLADFDYRSGVNFATGEHDGAGIRFYGLPTEFFNQKTAAGEFRTLKTTNANALANITQPLKSIYHRFRSLFNRPRIAPLQDGQYAVGQYFLSTTPAIANAERALIEKTANAHDFTIVGWRSVDAAINTAPLSAKTLEKKPSIWQAIWLPKHPISSTKLEHAVRKASITIANQAKAKQYPLHIVSQSSESITYKGMVRPSELAHVYLDLQEKSFKVYSAALHGRFATNKDPQWRRAQPFKFIAHNGEFNSAPANAIEIQQELNENQFEGLYPDASMSDSMQFDVDLLNQMLMKDIPIAEALVRLMPPTTSTQYSDEVNALLRCVRQSRSPYNGPAFVVLSADGYHIAKLDECGLRPSHWGIIEFADGSRQFHAASDDYLEAPPNGRIIKKGELKPGGIVMITPEGELWHTQDILENICKDYNKEENSRYFQTLYHDMNLPLVAETIPQPSLGTSDDITQSHALNRILFAAGWDFETANQTLRYMADFAAEPTGAMGDDTNPLNAASFWVHFVSYFRQLFAQISAPALDSIKERARFTLQTTLGPKLDIQKTTTNQDELKSTQSKTPFSQLMQYIASLWIRFVSFVRQQETTKTTKKSTPKTKQPPLKNTQHITLSSPILSVDELPAIEHHPTVTSAVLDTTFTIPEPSVERNTTADQYLLEKAILQLLQRVDDAIAAGHSIIILSDRTTNASQALIPDVIAVGAVRRHLENKNISRAISIVSDSYQLSDPHHAAMLLATGANAVYARGAYEKITDLYPQNPQPKYTNVQKALEKCLLKTMGKMGITDVNNYINGRLFGALGLNLSPVAETLEQRPSLSNIFPNIYSPLKGINLGHIAHNALNRHYVAHDNAESFQILPRSGQFMPEKNGIKHGYGPEVVNAFTDWMKSENIRAKRWQLHTILERKGYPGFITDLSAFTPEAGFLDPREKENGIPRGTYPIDYLARFRSSKAFQTLCSSIDNYKRKNPTSLRDYLLIKSLPPLDVQTLLGLTGDEPRESTKDIRRKLFSGSMSQGALTVANAPGKKGAHETLTAGVNAVHAMSASGEGGEAHDDLRNPLTSTRSKQIASGRFGNSAMQIATAIEIEIKAAQGAKPGEGGELPGTKVSIRFAAQRGGLPGTPFISPPPHHDIYSIEDLAQLIHDIKAVNPHAEVAVKLVASEGIGTIALGVAKTGADVINIASNSGGTAAAQQSSIKHAGFPGELGLAEVDMALHHAGLRQLVKLRTSGGLKTAEDIILAAILGADQFELGTTSMLTLNCKMQRTCNKSCQPGVATDGHLFKGDEINTSRYYANLAAEIHERLEKMGVPSLELLRGRTELLELLDPTLLANYDFSALLNRDNSRAPLNDEELKRAKEERECLFNHALEDDMIPKIKAFFASNPSGTFVSDLVSLTTQHRSYGARIAGEFAHYLEEHPHAKIILRSQGIAGQSLGFVTPHGLEIHHNGSVQAGCGKSMTDGELVLTTPNQRPDYTAHDNTLVGNVALYGASGGKAFINGKAGHRFGILMKGAEATVEGVGDLAFEYMTSGTGMILGAVGDGLGTGASGGILFVYQQGQSIPASDSLRSATSDERHAYTEAILAMLKNHQRKTGSVKAQDILSHFELSDFQIYIPTALDTIKTLQQVIDIIKTYVLKRGPLTPGMQVWLEQKALHVLDTIDNSPQEKAMLTALLENEASSLFSQEARRNMLRKLAVTPLVDAENLGIDVSYLPNAPIPSSNAPIDGVVLHPYKKKRTTKERLSSTAGTLDNEFSTALTYINSYVMQLSKDAQGCSGCRAQSCAGGEDVHSGCPGGKSINTINDILKQLGTLNPQSYLTAKQWTTLLNAFVAQLGKMPFISGTGAACPAPCESACTETIPDRGVANAARGGKPIGEAVHIKDIEYYLYQIGRSFGWFNGKKEWTDEEITAVFGNKTRKAEVYDSVMQTFTPPFTASKATHNRHNKLLIVGSGPAAMQIAYDALRDGVTVDMYEKSDKAGGLLTDGIPAHKFDKKYIEEDIQYLISMGLTLHVNSEVSYDSDSGKYMAQGKIIGNRDDENQYVALCVGAGAPQTFKPNVTQALTADAKTKIVQAVDFLKAANDIAQYRKEHPCLTEQELETLIQETFKHMDPRKKKIIVVGGGDTAQDAIRWIARYFYNEEDRGELNALVRGPQQTHRAIADGYPALSQEPTKENQLKAEEIQYIGATASHLIEPIAITTDDASQKLTVHIKESHYTYHDAITSDDETKHLFDELPREERPLDAGTTNIIDNVDMVICALGFQSADSIPIVQHIKENHVPRVFIAGDAAAETSKKPKIIIGAQANGQETYQGQIKPAMNIVSQNSYSLTQHSLFKSKSSRQPTREGKRHYPIEPSTIPTTIPSL